MIFDADLRGVVDDVFGDAPAADAVDASSLWRLVSELDWPLVGVPEELGGPGGDLAAAAELAAGTGRHAVPVPLVETGLAAWALATVALPVAAATGRATVAHASLGQAEARPVGSGGPWRLAGTIPDVRWLPAVDRVVVVVRPAEVTAVDGTVVAVLDPGGTPGIAVEVGRNFADEPLGTLRLDGVAVPAHAVALAPAGFARDVLDRAALLRAAAIAGAVERACELVKEHVSTRRQFGRPLAALAPVGQLVARLAVERDLLDAALAVALDRPGHATAAAARAVAAACAGAVATGAHQLHGAIGLTQEHPLHRLTRRLWAWRDEDGSQRRWEELVGAAVLGGEGDDCLWSLVTGARPPAVATCDRAAVPD
ncbi:MAG: acyl-CoA/acyl-ACP dehydrogenase [Frankia sp.]|nr:acyl-CoA/acyl-ACP dehydrogenase [Frankia sp.]